MAAGVMRNVGKVSSTMQFSFKSMDVLPGILTQRCTTNCLYPKKCCIANLKVPMACLEAASGSVEVE
jgi:hypothetical protein